MVNHAGQGLVDVHHHFLPDAYRRAAVAAGHAQPDGMPELPAWSEMEMLAMMDAVGVEFAALSISSPGVWFGDDAAAADLARLVNEEGARLKSAHPTRVGFFASLPLPHVERALAEIDHAFDALHADGVVLYSNTADVYPGDARFEPVFRELNRRKAVVFLHPTSPSCPCCQQQACSSEREGALPRPVLEFMFETTRAVTSLIVSGTLTRHPDMKVIVPHAGATLPVLADRIATTAAAGLIPGLRDQGDDPVFGPLRRLYYDVAGMPVPRLLPALRTFADPAHLLYGSDWPFTPQRAVRALLGALEGHLSPEAAVLAAIRRDNAARLFPRLG
ncbi:MAG: amidohydrolase family protein [Pseudomonadales bacterium]